MAAQRPTPAPPSSDHQQHHQDIHSNRHTYEIVVGGTMDGTNTRDPIGYGHYGQTWEANVSVRLENIGTQRVKNPRLSINGQPSWRSLEDVVQHCISPTMSDAEKARALWEFARHHRYHFTTGDDEVKDTVKMLNVYGYTLCWDEAYTLANLWQQAGLQIRRGVPHGHCTTEVYYDGMYHLLDSDEHLLVLMRDNETIAGESEIACDHDLMKRAHAYGILSPENRHTSEGAAALFVHTGPRAARGRPRIGSHRMDFDLRPGEALEWRWEDRGKYHGYNGRPPRLCNGLHHFAPLLDAHFERWATTATNLKCSDGCITSADPLAESILCYHMQSPYVYVGGSVEIDGEAAAPLAIELTHDGQTWHELGLFATPSQFCLDAYFPPDAPARYSYWLRLRGKDWSLRHLRFNSDVQMAPLSLPALEVGTNRLLYQTDAPPGEQPAAQVRITHTWRERHDSKTPGTPRLRFPLATDQVEGTHITFCWDAVEQADDYHFQLSPTAAMTYCLSPTFDKLISKTPSAGNTSWQIPYRGLLNPDTPYYWRLRARNADGLWGPWSQPAKFVAKAPGVPLQLRLESNWTHTTMTLSWKANNQGNAAHHYEIYGSDERGFSACDKRHEVLVGSGGQTAARQANLLATTTDTSLTVVDADLPRERGNCAFYRVVAVDAAGERSGPSELVEAIRPFIYSRPPAQIPAEAVSTYSLATLSCSGDLRAISDGPKRYISAFRDADCLSFLLDEGPAWIELDQETGLMTATPPRSEIGTHTVTVRVQNGQGGTAVQGFDLEVIAP